MRKPGRFDRRPLVYWQSSLSKRRPPRGDLCKHNAPTPARSDGSFRPAPILLRATPNQNPHVELRSSPENDDWTQPSAVTRPLCAQPCPLRPAFLDTKERDSGCSQPEMPTGPIPPPAELAFRPRRVFRYKRPYARGGRSRSDWRVKGPSRASAREDLRQISIL